MHAPAYLQELVVVFGVAVLVVLLLSRFHLPAIAGFIAAGALVGPSGLALVEDEARIGALAEVGVVLLLFTIGLEFSLERLRRLWRPLLVGGGLQVGLTVLAVAGLSVWVKGYPPAQGLFFGFLVALSSTAIVLRALTERHEVDAPHGQLIVGVLIFQDLCVVPMMLLLPLLAGQAGDGAQSAWSIVRALGVVLATLVAGRALVPRVLALVAHTRRRELFLLAVLLVCTGVAWLTSLVGLSLALGAFLAGIALAESEYGHQALSEVLPFREALASLFFVSVGMLFDVRVLLAAPLQEALLLGLVLGGKAFVATLAALVLRFPPRVAVLAGVGLAQVGEFSFVLSRHGTAAGLLTAQEERLFVSVSVLTMLVTPLLLRLGPHLAAGAARLRRLEAWVGVHGISRLSEASAPSSPHVIVAGYGVAGRMVARSLTEAGVPHLVVELDPRRVASSRAQGEPVYYGDITSPEILQHAGVERARALLLLINDPDGLRRAVMAARRLAPDLPIVVRTPHVRDIPGLVRLGASDVVASEFETALETMMRTLRASRVEEAVVRAHAERARLQGLPGEGPVSGPRRMLGLVGGRRAEEGPAPCVHLQEVRAVAATSQGCEECLAQGHRWVSLRQCLSCGHVGCCDSSQGKHATAHFRTSGHPLMRSLEPGEEWAWCFVHAREVPLPEVSGQGG